MNRFLIAGLISLSLATTACNTDSSTGTTSVPAPPKSVRSEAPAPSSVPPASSAAPSSAASSAAPASPAVSNAGVEIDEVVLGTAYDKATDRVSQFVKSPKSTDKVIYVAMHLRDVQPAGWSYHYVFRAVDATFQGKPIKDVDVFTGDEKASKPMNSIRLTLSAPTKGWPPGKYRVIISAKGLKDYTYDFDIKSAEESETSGSDTGSGTGSESGSASDDSGK